MSSNSLDLDQARQNVGPNLDPNYLTLIFHLNKFFEKNMHMTKSMIEILPSIQDTKGSNSGLLVMYSVLLNSVNF